METIEENKSSNLLQGFPDHILLLVFGYLDTVSLVRASRVCCCWYNVTRDQSLTKVLDLRLSPLKLKQLWSVCQKKLTCNTTSIYLKGASNRSSMDKLTLCYLEMLKSKVPNMKMLTLENFDLREIPLTSLPSNLKTLSLYKSMLTMGWFDILKCQSFLTNLNTLDLHCCTKVANNDLESLAYLESVTELNLSDCFRISARGIIGLTVNLRHLKDVNFSGCPGVNNVVLHYLSNLPLEQLKLRFCHHIDDNGIQQLFLHNVGKTLQFLDIYSCHEITDHTMDMILANTSCLRKLDIGACNKLTPKKVDFLKHQLPGCHIHFEILSIVKECSQTTNGQFCKAMMYNGCDDA